MPDVSNTIGQWVGEARAQATRAARQELVVLASIQGHPQVMIFDDSEAGAKRVGELVRDGVVLAVVRGERLRVEHRSVVNLTGISGYSTSSVDTVGEI